jgi:hypothetical protein
MTEQLWVPQLNAENLSRRLLTFSSLEDKWLFTGKRKVYFKISDAESITSYIKF